MSHNTQVHVDHDPMMNTLNIKVQPATVAYKVSLDSLLSIKDPNWLIQNAIQGITSFLAKDVVASLSQALSTALSGEGKFNPHEFPKIEVSKNGKSAVTLPNGVQPAEKYTPWKDPAHDLEADIKYQYKKIMNDFITKEMKFELEEHQKHLLDKIMGNTVHDYAKADAEFAEKFFGTHYTYVPADPGPSSISSTGSSVVSTLFQAIPGFAKMRQPCPEGCKTYVNSLLKNTIIHLNDYHQWTRERIADWLETLDHDLTFQIPEEVKEDAEHTDT